MNNIKRIRTEKELTQNQLSRITGVSIKNIQKYESGEVDVNNVSAITLLKIATALGCEIKDLLDDDRKTTAIQPIMQHYEDEIIELVETELDENCHSDFPDDYESSYEFYISNVVRIDYREYILERFPDLINYDEPENIQMQVLEEIKRRCNS